MKQKILLIDNDSGLFKSLKPKLKKPNVDFKNNSELEDKLELNTIRNANGYSIEYNLPWNEKLASYDIIFVNYKPGYNKGLTLALELKTDTNKVYVMSCDTLYLHNLIENKELTGYIHKNGSTIKNLLDKL